MTLKVALVSTNEATRLALVRCLEGAPADWSLSLHREPPEDVDVIVCADGDEITGAITVDPSYPDEALETIRKAAHRAPTTIAVTAVDGGAGVTTVALHLASALGRGAPTSFVDLDPGRGAHHRLGLEPGAPDALARPVPLAGGFRFMADAGPQDVGATLTQEWRRIVVDTPGAVLGEIAALIDVGLLLVRPTPSGARRARRLIECHEDIAWCPVVNRVGRGGQTTTREVASIVGTRVFELPPCPALRDVEDEDRLLAPGRTRWSRRVNRLAEIVAR